MTYRIRFHPLVTRDLEAIAQWIIDYTGSEVADRKLAEIEQEIASLARTPHKGSIRDEIAPGCDSRVAWSWHHEYGWKPRFDSVVTAGKS